MSTVYIVQEPVKRDLSTGQMVSMMNFDKARKFGDPVVCCPSGPVALNTAPVTWNLRDKLRDFSDDDYLICVGDPTLLGMASAIAAEANRGRVRFLKWSPECRDYYVVDFNMHLRANHREED